MKNKLSLILYVCILLANTLFAQQPINFKEKTWLKLYKNKYCTLKGDTTVVLKYVSKNLKKRQLLSTFDGISGNDKVTLVQYSDSIPDYNKAKIFKSSDWAGVITFPGRILMDYYVTKDKIFCYPWSFNVTTTTNKDGTIDLKTHNKKINTLLDTNIFYIDIPQRKAIQLKYSSLQLGAMVLPVKIYLFSSGDSSLRENVVFNTNFNGMIGYKWGKKKISNLPHLTESKVGSYSTSINALLGINKLDLTSENTSKKTNTNRSIAAISTGLAFGYNYNIIGLYIASGIDIPLGSEGQNWDFKYMPWLGFGLGINLGL